MSETIRVVVADDHPLFRDGVVGSLDAKESIAVVGEAGTGEEAFDLVADLLPDVLLLDIAMPGEGGVATAAKVAAQFPVTKVLMLTVSENPHDLLGALKAGARGYVLKGVSADGLAHAVRAVAAGEVYLSRSLAGTILFEMTREARPSPVDELTERECEIFELVGEGLTNREIADRLYLAEKTVKHYMTNVLQKLQVRSRVEAALLAQRRRLGIDD